MNAIVERLRGLDYNRKLTFLRERNGNIEFLGSTTGRLIHYGIFALAPILFVGTVEFSIFLSEHLLSRFASKVTNTGLFQGVAFFLLLCGLFLWRLMRKSVRFAIDTNHREITFTANRKTSRISLDKIDYILVFRELNYAEKGRMFWGGHIAIVDRQGRTKPLSSYLHLESAESDGAALARLCHLPCLCLGIDFDVRELWYISEPYQMYFGETEILEKLRRSYGVTLARLTPFAKILYQPNPEATTENSDTAAVPSVEPAMTESVEEGAQKADTSNEARQNSDMPRQYAVEEPQQVLQQRR